MFVPIVILTLVFQTCIDDLPIDRKAFNLAYSQADEIIGQKSDSVRVHIGSIQYIHVPKFLHDLADSLHMLTGEVFHILICVRVVHNSPGPGALVIELLHYPCFC